MCPLTMYMPLTAHTSADCVLHSHKQPRRQRQQLLSVVCRMLQDEEAVLLRIKLAQKLGVLSCSECNLAALPAQFIADDAAVAAVQVGAEQSAAVAPCQVLNIPVAQ